MKTKLQLIIMSLVLLFMAGGQSVCLAADSWSYPPSKPDGKFGGGSGSYYDPYLINNAQQLADLAYMVNHGEYFKGKYFKLTTDITLNDNSDNRNNNTSRHAQRHSIYAYSQCDLQRFQGNVLQEH